MRILTYSLLRRKRVFVFGGRTREASSPEEARGSCGTRRPPQTAEDGQTEDAGGDPRNQVSAQQALRREKEG